VTEQVEGQEAPYTITFKGGAGFEAPWLVVRAQSAEDAVALMAEAKVADLPKLIGEYAADFRASQTGAAPAQSAGGARTSGSPSRSGRTSTTGRQSATRGAAPQNNNQQQDVEYHPEGVTCGACGETVVYKKIEKGNRSFELWTCPNQRQRNDGHHSEFIN
jgi:hypothetical protein